MLVYGISTFLTKIIDGRKLIDHLMFARTDGRTKRRKYAHPSRSITNIYHLVYSIKHIKYMYTSKQV
jgi:hypothetical protein